MTNHHELRTRAENESKRERLTRYASALTAVQSKYAECRQLPTTAAAQIDRDAEPNRKLTPTHIEFCVDVERITERALLNRLDLQAAWFTLLDGGTVPVPIGREVVERCGRLYCAYALEPWRYFRKTNHGSPLRRVA